jgi:phosphoglycerate dehydrogenase-like enzyme
MRVLATRRNVNRQEADALGVEMVDLETLLRQSDFVSLHLPLTPESYHLLDDAALGKMKPGAFLINTSRGALVDEHALAARLRDGRLAGAGLDTFEGIEIFTEQEAPPVHPLAELDNVILTPHVSGLSVEALEDVAKTAVENLVSVLSGRYPPPENIVNRGVVSPFSLAPYDPSLFEG